MRSKGIVFEMWNMMYVLDFEKKVENEFKIFPLS